MRIILFIISFFLIFLRVFPAFSSDVLRVVTYNLCNLAVYEVEYNGDEDFIPFAFYCLKKRGLIDDAKEILDFITKKEIETLISYMLLEKEVSFEVENPQKSINMSNFIGLSPLELDKSLKDKPLYVKKSIIFYLVNHYFYTQDYKKFLSLASYFKELLPYKMLLKLKALFYYRVGDYLSSFSLLKQLNDNFSLYWRYRLSNLLGIDSEIYEEKLYESEKLDFYKALFLWEKGVFKKYANVNTRRSFKAICGLVSYAQKVGMDFISLEILKECTLEDPYWFYITPELDNPYYALKLIYNTGVINLEYGLPFLYPKIYQGSVRATSWAYKVDEDMVYAVMRQESLFNRFSVSKSNAMGLMQVIPDTGRWLAIEKLNENYFKNKLFYPFYSIKYGVWYLSYLKDNLPDFLALAAYNSGPGTLKNWLKNNSWVSHISEIAEFYPKAETRNYLKKVWVNFYIYRSLNLN